MSSPTASPDAFDLDRIRAAGLWRHVDYRDEATSTNTLALAAVRDGALDVPALFLTKRQTAGRGRGANRWWSQGGGLTFSLVVDPEAWQLEASHWPRVSLCTALAVVQSVESFVGRSSGGIKWPNDVWLDRRKVCGILVELAPGRADLPARMVIGVGLNVNNSLAEAPDELRPLATSLRDATERTFDLTSILLDVVRRTFDQLLRLTRDPAGLASDWQARSVLTGRTVTIDLGTRQLRGPCVGIDTDGALLLQAAGEVTRVFGGVLASIE